MWLISSDWPDGGAVSLLRLLSPPSSHLGEQAISSYPRQPICVSSQSAVTADRPFVSAANQQLLQTAHLNQQPISSYPDHPFESAANEQLPQTTHLSQQPISTNPGLPICVSSQSPFTPDRQSVTAVNDHFHQTTHHQNTFLLQQPISILTRPLI